MTYVKKLVEILNDMFSRHDALADRCEVDKVKTLGDCYVASCGLLAPIANHAAKLTKFGIGMHGVMGDLNDAFNLRGKGPKNKDLRIRVGLASGTVVGGVVGGKKFIFEKKQTFLYWGKNSFFMIFRKDIIGIKPTLSIINFGCLPNRYSPR